MKNDFTIEELAAKYGLEVSFAESLAAKIEDKENTVRAFRMFADGKLPYEVATRKDTTINVAALRHQIAVKLVELRKNQEEAARMQMEHEKRIFEFYNGCEHLDHEHAVFKKRAVERVYIKDGHLVAFAHFEGKTGGIYGANNEVMPAFKWQPKNYLRQLRKINNAFFRAVKHAAYADDAELFRMDERTIRKDKTNER